MQFRFLEDSEYAHSEVLQFPMELSPINQAWRIDEVTWNESKKGISWICGTFDSSSSTGKKFANCDTSRAVKAIIGSDSLISFDITEFVRSWVSQPLTNFGVVVQGKSELSESCYPLLVDSHIAFGGAGHPNPAYRPKLILTLHETSVVPQKPATVNFVSIVRGAVVVNIPSAGHIRFYDFQGRQFLEQPLTTGNNRILSSDLTAKMVVARITCGAIVQSIVIPFL